MRPVGEEEEEEEEEKKTSIGGGKDVGVGVEWTSKVYRGGC